MELCTRWMLSLSTVLIQTEHDKRLYTVMEKVPRFWHYTKQREVGILKVRNQVCWSYPEQEWILPDPEKMSAINLMDRLSNVSGIRRPLGMVNQMGQRKDQDYKRSAKQRQSLELGNRNKHFRNQILSYFKSNSSSL